MSDAESRDEDARRERWEEAHADELDQECPDCGRHTLSKDFENSYRGNRTEPGCDVYVCPCGYEEEAVTR